MPCTISLIAIVSLFYNYGFTHSFQLLQCEGEGEWTRQEGVKNFILIIFVSLVASSSHKIGIQICQIKNEAKDM